MPAMEHDRVLVDFNGADDAGVYLLDDGTCLIQTVDFFTPVVDGAYDYGRIAAANALSDVYAMGGRPICALGIAAWPIGKYGPDLLGEIMRGGQEVCAEAGVPIIGGHSIDDAEPKYGLVVSGIAKREDLVSNAGSRPGDMLVLTKPLGSGIYTTAIKQEKGNEEMERVVIAIMSQLNSAASEAMVSVGVNACTDVTGYGLLGHLHEMMSASGTAAMLTANEVPKLPDLEDLIMKGAVPGGSMGNLRHADSFADWHESIGELQRIVLADAQTSGGLLISCPPGRIEALKAAMKERGARGAVIGVVFDGPAGAVSIAP